MASIPRNGHILKGTPICVDYWLCTPEKKYFHFLSHLHADQTYKLTSTFRNHIYTSTFNAWLIKQWFNIPADRVHALTLNEPHLLSDGEKFLSVTLIDANHCPGSVMFLFEGSFGCILYTGDFRYSPKMLLNPMLKSAINNQIIQRLYLDNTFAAEHCRFPAREEALEQVKHIVKSHPDHYIVIGVRNLGKEEVLRAVATELQEKVLVSERRMEILKKLHYEKHFTTNSQETRIQAKETHLITGKYLFNLKEEKGPVLTLLLSALHCTIRTSDFKSEIEQAKMLGIHRIPYSDHSSHQELVEFVSAVRPHEIHPIVCSSGEYNFRRKSLDHEATDCSCIPESILKFCQPKTERGTTQLASILASRDVNFESFEDVLSEEYSQISNNSLVDVPLVEICGTNLDQESMDITVTQVGKICGELCRESVSSSGEKETSMLKDKEEFDFISLSQENSTQMHSSGLNNGSTKENMHALSSSSKRPVKKNTGSKNSKPVKRKSDNLDTSDELKLKKPCTRVKSGDKFFPTGAKITYQIIKSLNELPLFRKRSCHTHTPNLIASLNPLRGPTQSQQRASNVNQQRDITLNEHNGNSSIANLEKGSTSKRERGLALNLQSNSIENLGSSPHLQQQMVLTSNNKKGLANILQGTSIKNLPNGSEPNQERIPTPNRPKRLTENLQRSSTQNLPKGSKLYHERIPTPNKPNGLTQNLRRSSTQNLPKGSKPNHERTLTPNNKKGLAQNLQRNSTKNLPEGSTKPNHERIPTPNNPKGLTQNLQKSPTHNLTKGSKPNHERTRTPNNTKGSAQNLQRSSTQNLPNSLESNQQEISTPTEQQGSVQVQQRGSTQNLQKGSSSNITVSKPYQQRVSVPNQQNGSTPNKPRESTPIHQKGSILTKQRRPTPNSQEGSTSRTVSDSICEPKSSTEMNRDSSSILSFVSSPQAKKPEERISDTFKDLLANRSFNTDVDSFSEAVNDKVLLDDNTEDELLKFFVPSPVGRKHSPAENHQIRDGEDDFIEFELVQNIVFYQDKLAERLGGKRLNACTVSMIANAERIHEQWNQAIDNLT